ncbi:MAG: DEAD/DEAH box helicase [Crocinitomicaceae bacterium]
MKFTELNLEEGLLEAISYMGFENATPIQEKAIPFILDNKDLIACAQTGTGKTGAFVLPILNKLVGNTKTETNTLIIVPTRELAIQIEQQIQGLSYFVSVSSLAVYGGGGGKDWQIEKEALVSGTDIIVATPGKLLSHLKLGYVKFDKVKHLVLDEADRMLDMGFIDDLTKIISYLPEKHQTLLFSATMAPSMRQLAQKILKNPEEISLSISKPAAGVDQKVYMSHDDQKVKIVAHLLKERKDFDSIIIFTSTKSKVSEIVKSLKRAGFPAHGISSNLEQDMREEVLRGFRSKRIRILVATDVMSRGIDVKEINMVINYDVPHDAEDYVHRVGRTARANTKGEAVTLVNDKDMQRMQKIESLIEMAVPKYSPPEEFGEGPAWREKSAHSGGGKKKPFYNKKKKFNKPKS